MILAHETAEQIGISDVAGLIAILLGQPYLPTRGKLDAKNSVRGTSVASKYISKIPGKSPVPLPTIVGKAKIVGGKGLQIRFTKIVGRFVGRAIPIVGWGVLAYDLGAIFYNTQMIFNIITSDERK